MAIAKPTFAGFTPEAIQFLADLAENNDRAWFSRARPTTSACSRSRWRRSSRRSPSGSRPGASRSRPTRSARRSGSTATPGSAKDKSPYKTNLGASFPWLETRRGGQPVAPRAPTERRLLQLPAGRDVRRGRDVEAGEAAPRRLPAGDRREPGSRRGRRSRSRASSPGSAR